LCQKLDTIKKKLPILKKELKDIDREIENVDDAKKIEVSRARSRPDDRVEEVMKSLHNIEAAKEAQIRLQQQELANLEDMTSSIIKQIDAMIKTKETTLNRIEEMSTKKQRRNWIMVYLPFYFVCYDKEGGKRYVVYPPSTICSMGFKTKLKGVFGARRMKSFLSCRSLILAALLDRLIDLTQDNPVFETEIIEAGIKANILRTTELRVGIKRGINELKDENWISEREYQLLIELML
jgi:hypothetical protein